MVDVNSGWLLQATTVGHCEQLVQLLSMQHGNIFDQPRRDLRIEAPTALAEATVSSSTVTSAAAVQAPNPSDKDKKKKKKNKSGWCWTICCCGCVLDPLGELLAKIIRPVVFTIVVLWIIWGANKIINGKDDLSNLPVFSWVPRVPEDGKPAVPLSPFSPPAKNGPASPGNSPTTPMFTRPPERRREL
jgi:hypothetical protein